jgi:hypothetical protein
MWKKIELSSDSGESGRKKRKRGYDKERRSLHLAGVWSQAIGFVLVRLA